MQISPTPGSLDRDELCVRPLCRTPPQRFQKIIHHIVPIGWQARFSAPGAGPHYKNIRSGRVSGPEGPGKKMAEPFANTVFDPNHLPNDSLENRLAAIESKALPALQQLDSTGQRDDQCRVDIAYLLAVQACRYPEFFASRLDTGKLLAVAYKDVAAMPDLNAANAYLAQSGMFSDTQLSAQDLQRLRAAAPHQIAAEMNEVLFAHGYEHFFNANILIDAALPLAERLIAFEWRLRLLPAGVHPLRPAYAFPEDRTTVFGEPYCGLRSPS